MSRVAVIVSLVVLALVGEAGAQVPLLELNAQVVPPTFTVTGTVIGTPGHFWGVGVSGVNSGLVVGGVPLELGTDVVVVGSGQLDALGRGVFSLLLENFQFQTSRLFIQGATSPDPSFGVLTPTPGKMIRSEYLSQALVMGGPVTGSGTVDLFSSLQGLDANPTESVVQSPIAAPCVVHSFKARSNRVLTASESITLRLRVNGDVVGNFGLKCFIVAGSATCTGDRVAITGPGGLVSMNLSFSGVTTPTAVSWSFTCSSDL